MTTLATPTIRSVKCKQSPIYGVFDRYFHTHLPIVTKHELGLPFPPRNLPIKFGTNPSTIFLVIVFTDRQTDRQTNAGKNTLHRFRVENNHCHSTVDKETPTVGLRLYSGILRT